MARLELTVNGTTHELDVESGRTLLRVLRDDLNLTGSKYGCGEGQCGACTVLIDGKPRRSCITPARSAQGKEITTIEGIAQNGKLHPVQQAFLDQQAMQCGYCTPGMIMTAIALLDENPNPSEAEIIEHMDSNICRCGTYTRIIAAIRQAAGQTEEVGS
jgi:aerobic-type carbon monoxide dehydrogenase small subunit (CoxS/CutS family)